MSVSARAGKPAEPSDLANVPRLVTAYYALRPDPAVPAQRVAFGTSGHRGAALDTGFNEAHILAITEAICRYREMRGYTGPLFIGKDTHALSEPAQRTALEVLVARGVDVRVDARDGVTPTPSVSHAILGANRDRPAGTGQADGIVVTPSHNPPDDGGFKYDPPNGGPADTDVWDPAVFIGSTHVTEPERTAVAKLREWGLFDAFREQYSDDGLFTYWDYRRGDFHQHRGMRIDLALVTRPLADRISWSVVDRNARKGQQPSDHAPLIVDFA
jgi:phosphoglucomutase